MPPGTFGPAGHAAVSSACERQRADPRLDAEPSARDDRAQDRRHVRALHAERGAAQHRERHAVLRAGVRVQDHRDQDDGVAEQDGDERLPPVHALLHQPRRERVGGDHHAHADPERGDVIRGPRAAGERRRREVGVPQRTGRDVLGQLDEVASLYVGAPLAGWPVARSTRIALRRRGRRDTPCRRAGGSSSARRRCRAACRGSLRASRSRASP